MDMEKKLKKRNRNKLILKIIFYFTVIAPVVLFFEKFQWYHSVIAIMGCVIYALADSLIDSVYDADWYYSRYIDALFNREDEEENEDEIN